MRHPSTWIMSSLTIPNCICDHRLHVVSRLVGGAPSLMLDSETRRLGEGHLSCCRSCVMRIWRPCRGQVDAVQQQHRTRIRTRRRRWRSWWILTRTAKRKPATTFDADGHDRRPTWDLAARFDHVAENVPLRSGCSCWKLWLSPRAALFGADHDCDGCFEMRTWSRLAMVVMSAVDHDHGKVHTLCSGVNSLVAS